MLLLALRKRSIFLDSAHRNIELTVLKNQTLQPHHKRTEGYPPYSISYCAMLHRSPSTLQDTQILFKCIPLNCWPPLVNTGSFQKTWTVMFHDVKGTIFVLAENAEYKYFMFSKQKAVVYFVATREIFVTRSFVMKPINIHSLILFKMSR